MYNRTSWLLVAGMAALCAAFSMTVRGPEQAVFPLLLVGFCYMRAQRA